MRRLPGILLATGAILIVVVALLISGLRLVLPELNHYRPLLLEKVQAIAGVPVEADFVQGSWETFGPTLEARNIRLALPTSKIQIRARHAGAGRVAIPAALALAVPRSHLLSTAA